MIVHALELGPQAAGVFLGATIHDVAQVVGAGYAVSRETGDAATVVKLMRVAMLLPVIICAAMISRAQGGAEEGRRPPLLPWFAVAFIVFVAINSTGWIAPAAQRFGNDLSRWCLVVAIAAIGMKTELKQVVAVGIRPVVLMIGETLFLAVLVLALMRWAF
jgi:uncharacterized integral membrane protein (TIGR00698 family)